MICMEVDKKSNMIVACNVVDIMHHHFLDTVNQLSCSRVTQEFAHLFSIGKCSQICRYTINLDRKMACKMMFWIMNYMQGFIMLSCLIAVSVNFSTFLVIGTTSPVTYQVLGHLKTCLVLSFGYILLHDPFNARNILGILIAIFGMGLYSYFSVKEGKKKATNDPLPVSQVWLCHILIQFESIWTNPHVTIMPTTVLLPSLSNNNK